MPIDNNFVQEFIQLAKDLKSDNNEIVFPDVQRMGNDCRWDPAEMLIELQDKPDSWWQEEVFQFTCFYPGNGHAIFRLLRASNIPGILTDPAEIWREAIFESGDFIPFISIAYPVQLLLEERIFEPEVRPYEHVTQAYGDREILGVKHIFYLREEGLITDHEVTAYLQSCNTDDNRELLEIYRERLSAEFFSALEELWPDYGVQVVDSSSDSDEGFRYSM